MLLILWCLLTRLIQDTSGIQTKTCLVPKPLWNTVSLFFSDPLQSWPLLPQSEGPLTGEHFTLPPQERSSPWEQVRRWKAKALTWCRTPSSLMHWVQASSGTQLPSSMTWFWGQKQPSEGWSPQELVLPSQSRGQPRSQWLYTRDGGHDMSTDREQGHTQPTPTTEKQRHSRFKEVDYPFLFPPFSIKVYLEVRHLTTEYGLHFPVSLAAKCNHMTTVLPNEL